jgi:hypothetical protein
VSPNRVVTSHRQRGQATVFVVVTVVVVLASLAFLYKAGKVTSEKMRLQNAADAAAYSISVLEARDLNFMAYTNRAMVANEVAIGQMVGIMSMVEYGASFPSYLDFYAKTIVLPVPLVGQIAYGVIRPVLQTIDGVAKSVRAAASGFLPYVTPILGGITQAYSWAQLGFHGATVVTMAWTYYKVVQDNDPNARISEFGVLAFLAHALTYGLPGPPSAKPHFLDNASRFVRSYREGTAKAEFNDGESFQEGMERLAAMVNASRDRFSKSRSWVFDFADIFPFKIPGFGNKFCVPWGAPPVLAVLGCFEIRLGLEKAGGSVLRYKTRKQRRHYSWSGADVIALNMGITITLDFEAFGDSWGVTVIDTPDFGAGFAGGAAQAGRKKKGALTFKDMSLARVASDAYGGAPAIGSSIPWLLVVPDMNKPSRLLGPTAPKLIGRNNIGKSYRGLPRYHDVKRPDHTLGFEAPFLIVGLVKEMDDVFSKDAPNPAGRLAMIDEARDGELAAIAKSEVYFSRPHSPGDPASSYFRRHDGQVEHANAFNPFWQARLVETSFADRVAALAIQQKEPWLSSTEIPVLGTIDEILDLF